MTSILGGRVNKTFFKMLGDIYKFLYQINFIQISENFNINFKELRENMIDGYERNKSMPKAGFAAGPCLYKDTAQLNAFLKTHLHSVRPLQKINQSFPKFIYENEKKVWHKTKIKPL